jgi:hypothetical protein
MKRRFPIVLLSAVIISQTAIAEPSMCVQSVSSASNDSFQFSEDEAVLMEAKYTCQQLEGVGKGLEATVLLTESAAGLAACVGSLFIAGVPVAIVLHTGAVIMQTAKVVVSNLPCEDQNKAKLKRELEEYVCEQMSARGAKNCQLKVVP